MTCVLPLQRVANVESVWPGVSEYLAFDSSLLHNRGLNYSLRTYLAAVARLPAAYPSAVVSWVKMCLSGWNV